MADEFAEELEHQQFLEVLNRLQEQIFFALNFPHSVDTLVDSWDDIEIFGDEPVFASLIFDMMLEES